MPEMRLNADVDVADSVGMNMTGKEHPTTAKVENVPGGSLDSLE
jgi:hypothetical protein